MQINNKDKDLINPEENQRKSMSPVAPVLFSCTPYKLSVEAVILLFPTLYVAAGFYLEAFAMSAAL